MQFQTQVCLLFLVAACQGVKLRSLSGEQQFEHGLVSELAAERLEIAAAEADYHNFWAAALTAQESELLKLQNVSNVTTAAVVTNATAAQPKAHSDHRKSPLTGLKLNLNPKSKADLIPALAMLKGLYDDGKARISKLNSREKVSKTRFESQSERHTARLARIEAKLANHTLRAEFAHNETIEENRQFKYWQGVRDREHRQFHTSLKIQHGTMSKEKEMIDLYEKTIAGTADEKKVKKELSAASGGGMPEIVFVQKDAVEFCQRALVQVRAAKTDLSSKQLQ